MAIRRLPISAVQGNDDLTPAARSNLGYDSSRSFPVLRGCQLLVDQRRLESEIRRERRRCHAGGPAPTTATVQAVGTAAVGITGRHSWKSAG